MARGVGTVNLIREREACVGTRGSGRRCAVLLPAFVGGGAQRIGLTLAGALAASFEVDLVVARPVGELRGAESSEVRVVDLNAARMATAAPRLVKYLREARPDGLISVLTHTNVAAIAAVHLAHTKTRVVVTEHLPPQRRSLSERVGTRLIAPLYQTAHVVAVSAGVRRDVAAATGIPESRIHVIYNPVDSDGLLRQASEPAPDLAPSTDPMLLSVGRLTPQKDHITMLRALARVLPEKRCCLLILGEGEGRGQIEAEVRRLGLGDAVRLPGFIANPYPHFRRAAVFVLSSRWEGLPTVLIEALMLGVPVISTDCNSGPREILRDGEHGTLVPVGDADALASAILSAVDSPVGPTPKSATSRYEPGQVAGRYAALLEMREPASGV
jgi:glycosyltransferase involved in cell wall biosynthesis